MRFSKLFLHIIWNLIYQRDLTQTNYTHIGLNALLFAHELHVHCWFRFQAQLCIAKPTKWFVSVYFNGILLIISLTNSRSLFVVVLSRNPTAKLLVQHIMWVLYWKVCVVSCVTPKFKPTIKCFFSLWDLMNCTRKGVERHFSYHHFWSARKYFKGLQQYLFDFITFNLMRFVSFVQPILSAISSGDYREHSAALNIISQWPSYVIFIQQQLITFKVVNAQIQIQCCKLLLFFFVWNRLSSEGVVLREEIVLNTLKTIS